MVLRSACRRGLLPALLGLLITSGISGQKKALTVEELYSYEGWTRFNGSQWASMTWVPDDGPWLGDTSHLWPVDPAQGRTSGDSSVSSWFRIEAATGASQPFFTYAQLESALAKAEVAFE